MVNAKNAVTIRLNGQTCTVVNFWRGQEVPKEFIYSLTYKDSEIKLQTVSFFLTDAGEITIYMITEPAQTDFILKIAKSLVELAF